MKGKTTVEMLGIGQFEHFEHSGIERGPLKMPEGSSGVLIAFGEDELYLHTIIADTGDYYGVYKSDDENHIYNHLRNLNT